MSNFAKCTHCEDKGDDSVVEISVKSKEISKESGGRTK